MTIRVHPHDAMRLVLRRLRAHGRDVRQDDRGAPTWVATCPAHEGNTGPGVRIDQHNDGTVVVHPHTAKGCTPETILAALSIDDTRIVPFGAANGHPFTRPTRPTRQGASVDSYEVFDRLTEALAPYAGRRSPPRYECPACGAKGDGHGLRVNHDPNRPRKILLLCDSNRCPPEEILEPLGMTLAELCAGDDTDDLGAEEVTSPPEKEPVDKSQSSLALPFLTLAELCAKVDAAGPRRYLIRGIWPSGAYGVHAAEMKAQKTWSAFDAMVSVASDTEWLGRFPIDDPGPVVVFAGEGGEASIVRRIRAICEGRSLVAETLPITICARAPHLADVAHLGAFETHLASVRPKLVVLDPLYLSVGNANGRDLYEMGHLLERPQLLCDQIGTSLLVVTHFNRGNRSGAGRIIGAGPAEWGRVLIGAEVKSRHTDAETKATTVVAELDVIGGEIPDQTFRIKRTIWADDPDDLDSPLHYQVEVVADDIAETGTDNMPPARRKLLEAVTALATEPFADDGSTGPRTQTELVDWIAKKYGHGLYRTTASRELNALREAKRVDCVEQAGRESLWFLPVLVSPSTGQAHPSTGDRQGVSPLSPRIGDSDTQHTPISTPDLSPSLPGADRPRADPGSDKWPPGTVGAEVNEEIA
jgi:hypothetical protein